MKNLILTITVAFILSACNSFNNERLARAEASYENGKYFEARNLCENILTEDPYNEDAINLLNKVYSKLYPQTDTRRQYGSSGVPIKPFPHEDSSINEINAEWLLNPACMPGIRYSRSLETIDDTWLLDYKPSAEEKRKTAKREKLKSEFEEFNNIIIPDFKVEAMTVPLLIKYLESQAKINDPDKRDVKILYSENNFAPHSYYYMELGQISLSDALISIFGEDDYEIRKDGNNILIKSL